LKFETVGGITSGLETLRVACLTCGASNPLKGIATKNSLKRLGVSCSGKQPWEKTEEQRACSAMPQVLQRGASSLYFGMSASAIDIPPHSDFATFSDLTLSITRHPLFKGVLRLPAGALADPLIEIMAAELRCEAEDVRAVIRREADEMPGTGASSVNPSLDLETDEWYAFLTQTKNGHHENRFITRHTTLLNESAEKTGALDSVLLLNRLIDKVVLAIRLREVRALVSFSRLLPEKTKLTPHLGYDDVDFLPAVEVFGEGVFFSLDEGSVRAWETDPSVVNASAVIESRRLESLVGPRLKPATPRFVLLHTLAHTLIRQLAFECGYSSSSIRERIYSRTPEQGEPQAGVLIYTAAGDSEGTMGGLVRQGEPPRLSRTILTALERASWCSLDPICRESTAQGFEGLNRGACHACTLVPETSCTYANALLDRSLLIGGLGGIAGFFQPVLMAATSDALRTLTEK